MADNIGAPPRLPDGTEGTSTIILTLKDNQNDSKKSLITYYGCVIPYNEMMKNFLNLTTNKGYKFFIYFCCFEQDWLDRLLEYELRIHRFTKPEEDKICTQKGIVVVKGCHVFVPATDLILQTRDFLKFINKYGKKLIRDHKIQSNRPDRPHDSYKGISAAIENELVKFLEISLSTNSSRLVLRDELFNTLVDGPLLCNDKVVGWCTKDPDGSKISVHMIGTQGTTVIWKTSSLDQSDGRTGSLPPSPSNANHQATVDAHNDENAQLRPPTQESPARYQHDPTNANQPPATVDESPQIPQPTQALLKNLIEQNSAIKDCLEDGLDNDYRLLKNWRHLADELKAPGEVKEDCKSGTRHSPTLAVLERPDIARKKSVQELLDILNSKRDKITIRKDVYDIINIAIPAENRVKTMIEDAFSGKDELMDDIARKLDPKPSSIVTKNWRYVGQKFGIAKVDLDLIERGHNPAEELLKYAYTTLPPEKKTAGEFRRILLGFKSRVDLHELLEELKIEDNDPRPLKSIIPPNGEQIKKTTALLNKCPVGCANWRHLAFEWKIESDVFDSQRKPSPTGKLLEWVCSSSEHEFTVEEFLNILGEKMKRYDVKEKLEEMIKKP